MIDKDFSKNQIERMEGMNDFPRGRAAAVKELILALQCFETNQKAEAFVSDTIKYESECPKPAVIRDAAYKARDEKPNKCPACRGTYFLISWWLITQESSVGSIWKSKDRLQGDLALNSIVGDMKRSEFRKELDPGQYVIEASEMCDCHPGKAQAS